MAHWHLLVPRRFRWVEPWSTRPGPVAQTSKSAVSRASQPAGRTANPVLPIWKSATQQVWKPALQDGELHWKRRGSHICSCSRLRILPRHDSAAAPSDMGEIAGTPLEKGSSKVFARWGSAIAPFFLAEFCAAPGRNHAIPGRFLPQRNARNSKRRGCVVSSLRSFAFSCGQSILGCSFAALWFCAFCAFSRPFISGRAFASPCSLRSLWLKKIPIRLHPHHPPCSRPSRQVRGKNASPLPLRSPVQNSSPYLRASVPLSAGQALLRSFVLFCG